MNSCSFREFILSDILKKNIKGKGVFISTEGNEIKVVLHISVTYGTNISAIVKSIKNKVKFNLNESAGVTVKSVNVCIDGIKQ